eukprot:TRINITY_DN6671_c0_g1_i3.p1 TRINITY_DN6671_c0_g1~~TRINITY_DN6671_c0_g1_i3.p1  ORF type:complete len:296 (-),score=110.29 TRINITY_DN6671_c0_g1_i3:79-966(-)
MSAQISLGDILSVSIDATQQAGKIIRGVWQSGELNVKMKGVNDPMTDADVKAQQMIVGLLHKAFGTDLKIVGEEDCDTPPVSLNPNTSLIDPSKVPEEFKSVSKSDVVVFVDPLDATKEFTDGNLPAVMSLVGISYKGKSVAGVMFQPFVNNEDESNGVTMYGMLGMGCFGVTPKRRDGKELVIATTKSHSTPELEKAVSHLNPAKVLNVGGAGYKSLLVLKGEIDGYIFPITGTKKWDSCAPEAIIKAAGGKLTDKYGRDLPYFVDSPQPNDDGIIVTLQNHEEIISKLGFKTQ